MFNGFSETARNWIMFGAIVAASFGAGAGFMGWMDVPARIETQGQSIKMLAANQMTLAEQLSVIRCRLDDLTSYECNRLQQRYRQMLRNPGKNSLSEHQSEDSGGGR